MNRSRNIIIGIILAVSSCGILIYSFETERTFTQIIIAFVVLYFPIAFISSFNRKLSVFILSAILILGGYLCYKQDWYDTIYGAAIALILGGATYLFRVSKTDNFSPTDYRQQQKNKRNAR